MPDVDVEQAPRGLDRGMGSPRLAESEPERRAAQARGRLGPAWTSISAKAALPGFSVKVPQMPARAAAAIRGFSSPFRPVNSPASPSVDEDPGFELKAFRKSYASLDSESDDAMTLARCGENPLGKPPSASPDKSFSLGANALQPGAPRLPFPLVSLPEAARLQRFRRNRGEEDHTELPGSFAARARSTRSGTFSTLSSRNSPLTPLSPLGNLGATCRASGPVRPAVAYHGRFSRRKDTRTLGPRPPTDSLR